MFSEGKIKNVLKGDELFGNVSFVEMEF